jgi:hypothetical protein
MAARAMAAHGLALAALTCVLAVPACAGNVGAHPVTPGALTPDQIDADPLALLPGSAAVVVTVDARAVYASESSGSQVAELSAKLVPFGSEAGFEASRDVDRVVAAVYSSAEPDVVAILSGHFDEAKIKQVAQQHTPTHGGAPLVESTYSGRSVYTAGDLVFSILTARTALVGTQTGTRHALDRIHDGHPTREIPAWIQETIDAPKAAATVCADLAQPVTRAAIASLSLSWTQGVSRVRAVATFEPPGMHLSGTISYDDAASAAAGASGVKHAGTMANLLALTGLTPRLENLEVGAADTNVKVAFSVDDRSLRNLLVLLSKYVHR